MRARLVTAAVLLAVSLAGCVPGSTPDPSDGSPLPSPTPLFADEEAALAAAEQSYREYQHAVDTALSDLDPSQLSSVATGAALDAAQKSVTSFTESGRHQVGTSDVDTITYAASNPLQVYACLDVSDVDVVDASGQSVVAVPTRRYPVLVTFTDSLPLLVVDEEVWDGNDFC